MLSKYKVLYSLKVQKQTKSVIAAIKKIESSDKEEYTDDEVAAIHKKYLDWITTMLRHTVCVQKKTMKCCGSWKKTGFVTAMIFTVIGSRYLELNRSILHMGSLGYA